MENASDALIMAGSIFLLIIALTVSISSFSRVKTQMDDIVLSYDKVQYAINSEDKSLLNFIQSNKKYTRTVEIESIIATTRRLRREDYDIYIILKKTSGLPDDIKTKLQENQIYETDKGNIEIKSGQEVIELSNSGTSAKYFREENEKFDYILNLLYNNIGNTKFKEFYGIYQDKTADGVSSVNKKDRKIITYVEVKE